MAMVVWQGWQIELPSRWSPVRLEGSYEQGMALFADLHRARLGLRWHCPKAKRFDPAVWSRRALLAEIGQLAADEAHALTLHNGEWKASQLYIEPKPPGRDVWVAQSAISKRAVEIIHHAHRRERILAETILPTLVDQPANNAMPWSVFDLSCIVPTGMPLIQQRLNLGDLTLMFGEKKTWVIVRQIAAAKDMALRRMPLEKWLATQQRMREKHHKPVGEAQAIEIDAQGRALKGFSRMMIRRQRFFFMKWVAEYVMTFALHDEERDRVVMVQGTDEELVEAVAKTVGWAPTPSLTGRGPG